MCTAPGPITRWHSEWPKIRRCATSSSSSSVATICIRARWSACRPRPWQEVVVDKDVNLYDVIPLFRLNSGDAGFFLDKACVVSRDLDDWDNDDLENVGVYRLQVKGPNRIGIQAVPQHDIARHINHAEARGEDLPVAIALGTEPLITLMAATPMLYDQLEYKMAAAMQGKPYRVVKTSKGLDVPWGAEYVLEGRLLARQREPEGPFGEFPGYYSGCHNYPVIEIDRISHRKDPIYDSVYVGRPWTELDYLQAMTTCAPIFVQLNSEFPEVVAVNALYTHGLVVIVSTKTRYGGFAKAIGLRVLTTTHGLGYAKVVIVVDADVDPFNLNEVMWAVSVKVNPSGRRVHRAESRGESARPCLFPDRNRGQNDHRCDHADRPRYSRQLRAGAGQAAGHRGVARQARRPDERPAEMSAATTDQPLPICPRCRSATTEIHSTSPVPGVWTVFGCPTCHYVWRSTEPEQNTNPDKYPEVFRLNPESLSELPVSPVIPPLRPPPAKS